MTIGDMLRLVWSNLRRMRGRAVMTAMGVLIGTAAIVVLISLASGLQESVTGDFSAFGPINQITVLPGALLQSLSGGNAGADDEAVLTPQVIDDMSEWEGVLAVTPLESVQAPSTLKLNRLSGSAGMVGLDPRVARTDMDLEVQEGSLQLGRWTVVAGALANENFVDRRSRDEDAEPPDLYGQTITAELTRFNERGQEEKRSVRLRVGGVLQEGYGQDDYRLFLALDDVEDLNAWFNNGQRPNRRRDGYGQAIIVIDEASTGLQIENRLRDEGFFAFSARSTLQQLNVIFTIIQAVFGGIGAIALLVAAIGIANTMVMSILERTREIGLMKAVGATNRDVMTVFVAEAGAIGLLGGIGGVAFGIGVSKVIDLIAQAYINAQLAASGSASSGATSISVIPAWLPVFAILFSIVIGLVSGIYPALRAVQLDPVAALKYE